MVQELRKALIRAKHELSSDDSRDGEVPLPDGSVYMREITRAEFEGLVQPILDRTMGPVKHGAGRRRASSRMRSTKSCWSAARRACRWCAAWSSNFSDGARTPS